MWCGATKDINYLSFCLSLNIQRNKSSLHYSVQYLTNVELSSDEPLPENSTAISSGLLARRASALLDPCG